MLALGFYKTKVCHFYTLFLSKKTNGTIEPYQLIFLHPFETEPILYLQEYFHKPIQCQLLSMVSENPVLS